MRGQNGGLSDYGQQAAAERESLLSTLVERLTRVPAGEERHGALLESCQAALHHHSFADTNPRHVNEQLDRFEERFGENAQHGKQRAAQLLRGHLLGLGLESSQYEFEHRLLSFLANTSRSPFTESYYSGSSALVAALEQQARHAVVGPPTYQSDDSADSWREGELAGGPGSPGGSQLSDWTDVELEADAEEDGGAEAAAAAAGAAELAAAAGMALQQQQQAQQQQAQQQAPQQQWQAAQQQAQQRRESPYTRTSLSVWLASKRSGGQPGRLLEPRLCIHEQELVQQALHMLKGVSTPGPAFHLDPATGAYTPRPGVHLHYSSHGSLRSLLLRLAAAATAVRRVQAFCGEAMRAAGRSSSSSEAVAAGSAAGPEAAATAAFADGSRSAGGGGDSAEGSQQQQQQQQRVEQQQHALPTVAAFAAAVAEQQQGLQQQLVILEAAASSGALLTLLQLQQRTAGLAGQAALLAALVTRCCCWRDGSGGSSGSPAETAAALLSELHGALQVQLLQARSQGGVLASMLLRVFAASCRPLLTTLHGWLYRGVLDDPAGEFFVQASGPSIPTDSPRFWSEAHTLRRCTSSSNSGGSGSSSSSAPAAPCFLLPLADSILAAGKAALLLHAYSGWRLAAAAAGGKRGSGAAAEAVAAAAAADVAESPSKRRLSEYGALGFGIAAGQGQQARQAQQQQQHPYGVPPPAGSLAALEAAGGSSSEGAGREPLLLHQQLLVNLEAQLQQHLLLSSSSSSFKQAKLPCHQLEQQQRQQLHMRDTEEREGAADSPTSIGGGSSSSGSHPYHAEWMQAGAACEDHTLLLPATDRLPPLPPLPASIEGLPAARVAIIPPAAAVAAASAAGNAADEPASLPGSAAGNFAGGGSSSGGGTGQLSIADRMRAVAEGRVQQAACAAAEQLPLLLIPPAPLQSLAAAATAAAAATDADAPPGTLVSVDQAAGAAAAAAAEFDSSGWQRWYQHVAAALSQQLQVLDSSISGGSSSRQQLASSYGVPLGLPQYTGCAAEQLWGRGGTSSTTGTTGSSSSMASTAAAQQQRRQQLLQPRLAAEAPPLEVLLRHSLLRPVQAQIDAAGGALCTALLRHGLLRQLAALRDTYLLGSPLLEPFVSFLLHRISTTGGGMEKITEFALNAALQDALVAGGKAGLLCISAQILPPAAGAAGGGRQQPRRAQQAAPGAAPSQLLPRVQQLGRLRFRVEPGWPLCLVVGEDMLAQYNAVLVLLLQLRWVRQSLQAVRYSSWKSGRHSMQRGATRDALQHQMMHLADSVLQYVNDRVIAAGTWLEQAMQACTSLDQMHASRSKYLRAVTRYCLLSSDGVARLVHEGLLHLLNACLQYCSLHKQAASTAAALEALVAAGSAALLDGGGGLQQQQQRGGVDDEDQDDGVDGAAAAAAGQQQPAAAAAAATAGLHRKAHLQQHAARLQQQLAQLRREFGNRQRLLLRVLSTKAAEAGSHSDELRQLLGALDFNRWFESSMA